MIDYLTDHGLLAPFVPLTCCFTDGRIDSVRLNGLSSQHLARRPSQRLKNEQKKAPAKNGERNTGAQKARFGGVRARYPLREGSGKRRATALEHYDRGSLEKFSSILRLRCHSGSKQGWASDPCGRLFVSLSSVASHVDHFKTVGERISQRER